MATTNDLKTGHVIEVIGPVVDVQFTEEHLPLIHNAVRITSEGFNDPEPLDIVAEVAAASGRKPRALRGHEAHRRPRPRHESR